MAVANEIGQFSQIASVLPEMPKIANLRTAEPGFRPVAEEERNPIFDALVTREGEIAGLVAYSIYKQNKRAWLQDFLKATGRPPTDDESRAYIIGESTDRRLATYRHLAAATLAGQGPDAPDSHQKAAAAARSGMFYLVSVVVLVAALAVLWFAAHSGLGVNLVAPK
jgi:hypothetical protein